MLWKQLTQIVGHTWLNLVTWTCGSWSEGQHWPIFHGPVILPCILKTIWCTYVILLEYESVWPDVWPKSKCGSLWPIFHGPWYCLIPWRLFHVWTSLFGIMNPYDPTQDLKINVGHCDLYFMVHWFCVISWRLFDVWTSSLGIMGQYDLKINVSLWPIFHGALILPYILKPIWWLSVIFQIMKKCDPNLDPK